MKVPTFCIISAVSLLLPSALQARTWKEAGSDRGLEGDYVKTEGDQVVIMRANGTTVKVALEKLSDDDKKFVAEKAAPAKDAKADTDVFKWETDMDVAKKRAREEKKDMVLDFTGSDWCSWCHKLSGEVFDTPEFQDYAAKHLIMVEVDFPHQKELPAKEKEQNDKLQQEYKIEGFPTIILLNSKGRQVGKMGYQEGGPAKYIEDLKKALKGGKPQEK
jgi:protein disulfide-isomerase